MSISYLTSLGIISVSKIYLNGQASIDEQVSSISFNPSVPTDSPSLGLSQPTKNLEEIPDKGEWEKGEWG